jgi:hypothetical protein
MDSERGGGRCRGDGGREGARERTLQHLLIVVVLAHGDLASVRQL